MKLQLTYLFDNEDELRLHLADEVRTVTPDAPEPIQTTVAPEPEADVRSADDVDADGMPYDSELHSNPPKFKADGTWRAARGKAEQEAAARAAFKAQGGDVEPPADLPTETAAPASSGLPGMDALPADAPEPVSFEKMVEAVQTAMQSGKIDTDGLNALYTKHGGADPVNTLQANETARAALVADLPK